MDKITVPPTPRFLFAPDADSLELYIVCTSPLALIWINQTTPATLYILEGPQDPDLLQDAAAFYRTTAANQFPHN
jgi:hypothetical protein